MDKGATPYVILNVDDDEANCYARAHILRRHGFKVLECNTGIEALRIVREAAPQAVLLDVRLPDINGMEVCRIIKTDPGLPETMVLQISAVHTSEADRIQGLEGGADAYLTEPIGSGELIATLRALLRLYERNQENRQLIAALRDSENRFRSIFELSAVGQAQVDLGTDRFVLVNRRFCEITGYSEDELSRMSPASIMHPEEREAAAEHDRRLVRGDMPEYSLEQRWIRKDGQLIWVKHAIGMMRSAGEELTRSTRVVQDITSQKATEKSLAYVHESLSLAQRAASGGVWDYNIKLDTAYVSAEYRLLYGLQDNEPMSFERWLSLIAEEDRDAMAEAGRQLFNSGSEWDVVFRVNHPTRGKRWLAGLGKLERDDQGSPVRFSGVNIDITERMRAEEVLREGDRRKDDFLAMLGHELRNPLGIINTAIQILDIKGSKENSVLELRDMIRGQIQHMRRLIDDLLDISRITTGKIRLDKEASDLGAVVLATANAYRDQLEIAALKFEINCPREPVFVECDQTRIAHVLGNLLHNAAKFTPSGGTVTVNVNRRPDESRVCISVKDTGIGIAPEALSSIFNIYEQAEKDAHLSREGLGLGLAVAKGLVELHGGKLSAVSEGTGKGSEFTIELPITDGSKSRPRSVESESVSGSPCRFVVIEDNPLAALSTRMILREMRHQVEIAHNGPEGIELARRLKPEVILCDIGLPGMDGYEVARRIRADPELNSVRLIALSGYGQDQDRQRALEAGFDAHFAKPIDFEKLQRHLTDDPIAACPGKTILLGL